MTLMDFRTILIVVKKNQIFPIILTQIKSPIFFQPLKNFQTTMPNNLKFT